MLAQLRRQVVRMSRKNANYLDFNAGAPLHPSAVKKLRLFFSESDPSFLANPSSIHAHGRLAKSEFAEAREAIAASLGAKTDPEQLVLTSSGSEANQLAIRSVLEARLLRGEKPHWITTPVEHDSVMQMQAWLKERGGAVSLLPVDKQGVPQIAALSELWRPETALVSLLWVNNETGVISPVAEAVRDVRARGALIHIDAAQAWGKLPIDLEALGAHYVTFSGHKIGGLAGTGLLWVGRGTRVQPVILGKQEKGRRGGTENLAGWLSVGAAAQSLNPVQWSERVVLLRDRLESVIETLIPGTCINGKGAPRVANTLNLTFDQVEGDGLVMALDLAGFSVSSGSACASGVIEPSHVLLAMGHSKQKAMAAVRVSIGETTPWEALESFAQVLKTTVERVRRSGQIAGIRDQEQKAALT